MSTCAPMLGRRVESFTKPNREVNRVFLHCSAASRESINAQEINQWHLDRGWNCIGYHFFCMTDGTPQYGRDIERVPSAQGGNNTGTIAICLNGLHESDFTQEQLDWVRSFCNEINLAYEGSITFHGHREVAAKECPVFDYKKVLSLDVNGYMNMVPGLGSNAPVTTPNDMPTVRMGYIGLSIFALQHFLHVPKIGHFDQHTHEAVKFYQEMNNLDVDGIVGPATWRHILE